MRCIAPRTAGFKEDGKTLSWSQKNFSKEYAVFQIPCGKCLPCRLNYAREWAVRCVHEAAMHENNSFITLTYSDENLLSDRLQYTDFQLFVKRLRKQIYTEFKNRFPKEDWKKMTPEERKTAYEPYRIGIFVTGEYGDDTKRPHWHAIIFNWRPTDLVYYRSNERGDKIYRSSNLDSLWSYGFTECGSVTMQSAGYVARYAAKKLVHGDETENFEPISKKSNHQAIGKKWIEKYYDYVFNEGVIRLPEGGYTSIPRYYEKWLQRWHPILYTTYVTTKKAHMSEYACEKDLEEKHEYTDANSIRAAHHKPNLRTRIEAEYKILKANFKLLQSKLKL